ncbi:SOS response-associated peptidase family protein [Pseudomonas citrulli]|uniref:SOS response-associated peptidase family protein n=1 Tax=Pseudomonas citrulli TaxID=3064347 RepID=A0ABT9BU92_9PSED|nr:SOS response-associated peptidase family protein [Pseudomonas sp. K18]MDO7896072.1 SOS response-associated peptidase family protein [Pseudomonas sp. K18]
MYECLVQEVSSKQSLAFFAQRDTHGAGLTAAATPVGLSVTAQPRPHDQQNLIKPNMQLSAIRCRGGRLECIKVRWGWSPIWSVGTMPPLTHLPLHLVMRSKVFDRIKREGRALVAVNGWYESADTALAPAAQRLNYTASNQASPIFLAALAQASETPNGCDGLTLVTYGDIASQQQRLLAFTGEEALQWLRADLDWEQAQQVAASAALVNPPLDPVPAIPRRAQGHN